VAEKFAANERSFFGSLQKVSVETTQWENILETVNSETGIQDLTTVHLV